MSSLSVQGENYSFLTFQTNDGTEYSIAVADLTISFKDGNMVASDGTTLPLSALSKMYFSTTSAIAELDGDTGNVIVFDSKGVRIGAYSSLSKALDALGKGMFVIQDKEGRTQKRLVK